MVTQTVPLPMTYILRFLNSDFIFAFDMTPYLTPHLLFNVPQSGKNAFYAL